MTTPATTWRRDAVVADRGTVRGPAARTPDSTDTVSAAMHAIAGRDGSEGGGRSPDRSTSANRPGTSRPAGAPRSKDTQRPARRRVVRVDD